jgi:head-tail adaptor
MSAELAGTLGRRLTILRRAPDRDDLGGAAGEWAAVSAVWGSLEPLAPAVWSAGDRPAATPRWRAVVRSGADVVPGDRLQWRLLLLAVRSVEADPATPDRLILTLEEDR